MSKQFVVGKTYKIVDESKLTADGKHLLSELTLPANKTFTCSDVFECRDDISACITQDKGVLWLGEDASTVHRGLFSGVCVGGNLDLDSGAIVEVV